MSLLANMNRIASAFLSSSLTSDLYRWFLKVSNLYIFYELFISWCFSPQVFLKSLAKFLNYSKEAFLTVESISYSLRLRSSVCRALGDGSFFSKVLEEGIFSFVNELSLILYKYIFILLKRESIEPLLFRSKINSKRHQLFKL